MTNSPEDESGADSKRADDDARARPRVMPHFDFRVAVASRTVRGPNRHTNEDAVLCRPDIAIFGMADGMGGHGAGDRAAQLALHTALETLETPAARAAVARYARAPSLERRRALFALLGDGMQAADLAVRQAGGGEGGAGMGTTLDLLLLARDRAFFAHVGDARAYLVRPTATVQLTHDHALFDTLRTTGKRTVDASRAPLSNSIGNTPGATSATHAGRRSGVTVDTLSVDLAPSDRLVMCTDGVFQGLDAEAALAAIGAGGPPDDMLDRLIGLAARAGAQDDMSVIVVSIEERFVRRTTDAGPRALDLATVSASPLLSGLPSAAVLSALAAGVEIELAEGQEVPCSLANDRVAYVVLHGRIGLADGRVLGSSGLLFAESLLDIAVRGELPKVTEAARLLRIRYDDFREVCAHDVNLAAQLFRRLARHLATIGPTPVGHPSS